MLEYMKAYALDLRQKILRAYDQRICRKFPWWA